MLRKLVLRLVMWLCARCDINPLDEARVNMGADKVARSQRWEAFANEEGGIFDMIEALRKESFEAYGELPPSAHDERVYLAMTDRNLRRLKQRVVSVITAGKIEARNAESLAKHSRGNPLKSVS